MNNRGIEYSMVSGTSTISRLFIAEPKLSNAGIYSCHPSYADPANITPQFVNGPRYIHRYGEKGIHFNSRDEVIHAAGQWLRVEVLSRHLVENGRHEC
ncbi:hypothetical protein NPIL_12611 [Nephila pilipes]|uniref:Uncharacterized protein n=1 Tax=Nephila pilipes TaxID=299642 RepID=A0A8X6PIH4_NEPPI|nr:hypothetical protein NPIL_12611 [Nephila pilipes]